MLVLQEKAMRQIPACLLIVLRYVHCIPAKAGDAVSNLIDIAALIRLASARHAYAARDLATLEDR